MSDQCTGVADDFEFSSQMSAAMEHAGFKAVNAAIQSGMALALQDILRLASRTREDQIFVCGSFADGWGSCLKKIDGSIDSDSDMDVTFLLPVQSHCMLLQHRRIDGSACTGRQSSYEDGHVKYSLRATQPNFPSISYYILPAFDFILAHPCCGYPRIELLQPGYRTHMPQRIMQQLREEVQGESPRCHAVAASPPGLPPGSCMRVSTTLLERTVMHNLTTVQGQLFILIKFLIKKVISSRVSGLKTYMAKNLLFYMLDETPEGDWKPENLLALVRQSLEMLLAMMESSDSDDVCMRHFFLRDANVYFKKDHQSKQQIVHEVCNVQAEIQSHFAQFQKGLSTVEATVICFHVVLEIFSFCEILASETGEHYDHFLYDIVKPTLLRLTMKDAGGLQNPGDQDQILRQVDEVPAYAAVSKECLKAIAYSCMGLPCDCLAPYAYIRCPATDSDSHLTVDEAKAIVLSKLQQMPLGIRTSGGRVCSFEMVEAELRNFAKLVGTAVVDKKFVSPVELLAALRTGSKMTRLLSCQITLSSWVIGLLALSRTLLAFVEEPQAAHVTSATSATVTETVTAAQTAQDDTDVRDKAAK